MKHLHSKYRLVALIILSLAACDDNDRKPMAMADDMPPTPEPVNYSYQVTVTNLTYGQPLSPIAVVLHDQGQFWQIGQSASIALENLAESGDNTLFIAQEQVLASASSDGVLMPGMNSVIEVSISDNQPQYLSMATMLVNTNDAFTGINAMSIEALAVGESISFTAGSYDAGTEKNSELSDTIPGPASAGEGEGYSELRDDIDMVAMHPGVVTIDDGLSTSVLTQAHRFDNPTVKVSISRIE